MFKPPSISKFHPVLLLSIFLALIPWYLQAQKATIRTEMRTMDTYAFSDPDPVANIGYIYPYFRFDGYTDKKVPKQWKMVILENDYIQVFITPEIGGKIWGAIEKSTGHEFMYFNHVVKFRDVAMRGAWTSGGIETNFGVIGHAPTVSTPVNYSTRENADGSVSCFIGATDLASGTIWRVEINLPADKAYFSTKSMWYNPTPFNQSYYHWMNAAVKTKGNLEYAYPGSNFIGHDGAVSDWPVNPEGRDISWYENNNFGRYKSYHVLGELTNFYGGYYHDDEFGFGHYSDYDDKPGKKLWIWGLSDQGMIWEKLLTDNDGQYTEVQSGRLFNQEASASILTPFRHRGFAPGLTDTWEELWFPIINTKGAMQAIPEGVLNMEKEGNSLTVYFYANEKIQQPLILELDNKEILNRTVELSPAQTVSFKISFSGDKNKISAKLGDKYIIPPGGMNALKTSRPLEPEHFNWNTPYGQYIQGQQKEEERKHQEAKEFYQISLSREPSLMNSLTGLAGIFLREGNLDSALFFVRKALGMDTYLPKANFLYGTIHEWRRDYTDALDGYAIASQSGEFRSAAYDGMARVYLCRKEYSRSLKYSEKALQTNSLDFPAREMRIMALRKSGRSEEAEKDIQQLLQLDPLNYTSKLEQYFLSRDENQLQTFVRSIQNEFPSEVFLEQGIKYYKVGMKYEALQILAASPASPMVYYWRAYIQQEDISKAEELISDGDNLDPYLVFPFRLESIKVLKWVSQHSQSWKSFYYRALIEWNCGNIDTAKDIFNLLGDQPDYFAYYLSKAELFSKNKDWAEGSLKKAVSLSPDQWRTGYALAKFYLASGRVEEANEICATFFKKFPENYYLGLQYANILMQTWEYSTCLNLLQNLKVLPNEGATEGRRLYRMVNLNLANESMKSKPEIARKYIANARKWPENLGVGRPYKVDERLEDFLEALSYKNQNKINEANKLFNKIINTTGFSSEDGNLLTVATYLQLNEETEAENYYQDWSATGDKNVVEWCYNWMDGKPNPVKELKDPIVKWVADLLTKSKL